MYHTRFLGGVPGESALAARSFSSTCSRVARGLLLLSVAAAGSGCALLGDPFGGLSEPPAAWAAERSYRFSPGDLVAIRHRNAPELDEEFILQTDGRACLPHVGMVQLAGKTAPEIREEIVDLWTDVLREPDPVIMLREARGSTVSIGGHVRTPNRMTLDKVSTVGDAVRAAGGLLGSSTGDGVVLVRGQASPDVVGHQIRFQGNDWELADRIPLMGGDLIYAPPSRTYKVLSWLDQHVNRLVPARGYVFLWYGVNKRDEDSDQRSESATQLFNQ